MKTPLTLIALCAVVLSLSACDKTSPTPPKPTVDTPLPTESATTGSMANPSVPSAESVLPSAAAASADPALGRSPNSTLSAAQESTAMPMPGQVNDHSAPLDPAKRASSP